MHADQTPTDTHSGKAQTPTPLVHFGDNLVADAVFACRINLVAVSNDLPGRVPTESAQGQGCTHATNARAALALPQTDAVLLSIALSVNYYFFSGFAVPNNLQTDALLPCSLHSSWMKLLTKCS